MRATGLPGLEAKTLAGPAGTDAGLSIAWRPAGV